MPAQFIRDEVFSFAPISREGRKTRWSIDAVVREATRDPRYPEAWPHVGIDRRVEPIVLTDMTLWQARDEARAAADIGKIRRGSGFKRFPVNSNALLSRVVSHPMKVDDFGYPKSVLADIVRRGFSGEAIEDPDVDRFVSWARMSVAWSKRDLGGEVAAVMHLDEENGHCHILRPLQIDSETGIASLDFWKPEAAMIDVRRQARSKGERRQGRDMFSAFKTAIRDIAEDYNSEVGVHFGHSLTSDEARPRTDYRTRKTITEAERRAAIASADAAAKTENERAKKAERERAEQRARAEKAEAEAASLRARVAELEQENGTLRERVSALLDQGRALAARARTWIGALRGDPAAVRDAGEAPTLTEGRIDAALGVSQADLQRRRVAAI